MRQCKQCGANLPDHANFCLQCGTAVDPLPQPDAGPRAELDFVQPALSGGMLLGILSSLPFISAGNCLCCAWVLLGGGVAAMMLTRQRPGGVAYGDGAFVGVLSGVFGAVVGTIVHIPVQIIQGHLMQSQQQQIEDLLRQAGLEGPMRDWMLRVTSGEISAATILFVFFMNLLMYSLFAMIGGILTIAILKKREQATKST